jgi:hypothetical protein
VYEKRDERSDLRRGLTFQRRSRRSVAAEPHNEPPLLDRSLDHARGALRGADVVGVEDRLATRRVNELDHLFTGPLCRGATVAAASPVVHHHPRATGGEQQCFLATDAASCPRDHRNLAVEANLVHRAPYSIATP